MTDWLHTLQRVGERGLDCVLVTVTSGQGSIPREAGAKMLVTVDAIHGTIGGGELEFQATGLARDLLREEPLVKGVGKRSEPGDFQTRRFPLGADLGQYCGGAANLIFERVSPGAEWVGALAAWQEAGDPCVLATPAAGGGRLLVRANDAWGSLGTGATDAGAVAIARRLLAEADRTPRLVTLEDRTAVLLEPLQPSDFRVVVFGAGHVGRALVRVLGTLPCRVTWVDARAGEFPPDAADNVRIALTATPVAEVAAARPGACFLVMTHSHALDLELVAAILKRGDFAYCGMIGSQTKRRTFEKGLAKHGVPAAAIARLTCPIGIPGIKGKEPGTIAVAVAAQLLEQRGVAGRALNAAAEA
ncbi:MAG: xanthine dehydrogenase accessory protein XdhC [Burkholderiales bacterium]